MDKRAFTRMTEDENKIRLNPYIFVGRMIRELREDRDLSQVELASRINKLLARCGADGIPMNAGGQPVISRIEFGERKLTMIEGLAIAEIYRIDDPYIFAPWRQPGFPKYYVDEVKSRGYTSPFKQGEATKNRP